MQQATLNLTLRVALPIYAALVVVVWATAASFAACHCLTALVYAASVQSARVIISHLTYCNTSKCVRPLASLQPCRVMPLRYRWKRLAPLNLPSGLVMLAMVRNILRLGLAICAVALHLRGGIAARLVVAVAVVGVGVVVLRCAIVYLPFWLVGWLVGYLVTIIVMPYYLDRVKGKCWVFAN